LEGKNNGMRSVFLQEGRFEFLLFGKNFIANLPSISTHLGKIPNHNKNGMDILFLHW